VLLVSLLCDDEYIRCLKLGFMFHRVVTRRPIDGQKVREDLRP
jgi:hypothetical protein